MNRILVAVLVVASVLSGCGAPAPEGVEVRDAWARPAAQGANGAVYFVLHSSREDELVGVSTNVADAAEMHESMMDGDVMQMHQMDTVPLPAGEQVTFKPGGLHIMLVGLKQELKVGDEIEITLDFKNFQDLKITVPVRETPVMEDDHSSNSH